jgi:HAD superfamily hydrolase (TIGR01509 family)
VVGGSTSEVSDANGATSRADAAAALKGPGVVIDGSDAAALRDDGSRRLSALIVDWGGVLTDPLDSAMTTWASREGIDFSHFADVMQTWVGSSGASPVASGGGDDEATRETGTSDVGARGEGPAVDSGPDAGDLRGERSDPLAAVGESPREPASDPAVLAELEDAARRGLVPASPVHALERGEIGIEDFERLLAAALRERGSVVQAEGLLTRVLSGLAELRDDMLGLVRRARHSGIRTALLSNSWGDHYPEEEWEGAFDAVVISGRVGMRKPDAEIFRHTADLLGVPVDECVMVDDLAGNIRGAVAAGMVGVLHQTYEDTAEELEILFDRRLR